MFRSTSNRRNGKFVRATNLDGVATRRAKVGSELNYITKGDPTKLAAADAVASLAATPAAKSQIIDADGQLTLVAGAYPVGTAKYLTKDISGIAGDWEFTFLMQRTTVEFGVVVTDAAGTKAVALVQRSASPNNAVFRQTTYATTATPTTFTDAAIYQSTLPIWYNVRKVGTNILFYTSSDGTNFTLRHTEALATHILTADRIGFYLGSSTSAQGSARWFVHNSVGSPYTDMFDDRSLNVAWQWYNDAGGAVATEANLFYGTERDNLPITLEFRNSYGIQPDSQFVDNNSDQKTIALAVGFEYGISPATHAGNAPSDNQPLALAVSFTYS